MGILLVLCVAGLIALALVNHDLRVELRKEHESRDQGEAGAKALRSQVVAMERAKAESRALSDVAFDAALALDEALNIIGCNQAARHSLAQDNLIGQRLDDIIDSPELRALAHAALRGDECLDEQFVAGAVNFRARAQVFALPGGQRVLALALQDITDLVNLHRARRDLVANISHELRTPITRIRLIIEGLFLDADKPKRKASIQSLKEIAMETDALLWLAQELLDLSMIESGEAILRLVSAPLRPMVEDAVERLEAHADMKGLTIVCHVPPDAAALCDADQLKRVLGNLIHNAIKWSPPGETITITASERDDEIVVSVVDKGPGVPEELRDRVFERFYQADSSRSSQEGAGLGLAICKHIIEAHGGRIWSDGKRQGQGGRFRFTLLRADGDSQPAVDEARALDEAAALPETAMPL